MNIQWGAEKYMSDFSSVHKYGNSVTELIEAPEGSRVLDLGCGNGALTQEELFSLIRKKAEADERIRAAALDGSRANPAALHDEYSDFGRVGAEIFSGNRDFISGLGLDRREGDEYRRL